MLPAEKIREHLATIDGTFRGSRREMASAMGMPVAVFMRAIKVLETTGAVVIVGGEGRTPPGTVRSIRLAVDDLRRAG